MIEYKSGDIFADDAEAIVNSVNCVGVMERGIALQFKNRFPDNFSAYAAACKRGEVVPGKMFVFETGQISNPRYIINFPTKRHWRGKSRIEDIESGLAALANEITERGIRSIAIPSLGSGLGRLDWDVVRVCMRNTLQPLDDVKIVAFTPDSQPEMPLANPVVDKISMTPARATLIVLIHQYLYLNSLLEPFVTLLEIHKLMYFAQEAGEPLKLTYRKAPHGPYAENLRHMLMKIENRFISGYQDNVDTPNKPIDLMPQAAMEAESYLENNHQTRENIARVHNLVDGFDSSFGLELLATVHWVAKESSPSSDDEIIERTYQWGEQKRKFSERQIKIVLRRLSEMGWIRQNRQGSLV